MTVSGRWPARSLGRGIGCAGKEFGREELDAAPGGLLLPCDTADEIERPMPDGEDRRWREERSKPARLVVLERSRASGRGNRGRIVNLRSGTRIVGTHELARGVAERCERKSAGSTEPCQLALGTCGGGGGLDLRDGDLAGREGVREAWKARQGALEPEDGLAAAQAQAESLGEVVGETDVAKDVMHAARVHASEAGGQAALDCRTGAPEPEERPLQQMGGEQTQLAPGERRPWRGRERSRASGDIDNGTGRGSIDS